MNANSSANAYLKVGMESSVQGADPQKLISLLYQGALLAIANGKNGILRNDIPSKGKSITHAIRIIEEGLKASLDMNAGGNIASDLDALYGYMCLRLLQANLKNDIEALDEVSRLLGEIKGAWDSISQPTATPIAPQLPIKTNSNALVYARA